MNWVELTMVVPDKQSYNDILVAYLSEAGYDMFEETDSGLNAYIREAEFRESAVIEVLSRLNTSETISWKANKVLEKNWNEEWEKSFQPVRVKNCHIRASFHPFDEAAEIDIVIDPKMSFGTGHHETTSLMVEKILEQDMKGKIVLDMGCGTGILAILASKLGSSEVIAIDNDSMAIENCLENIERNKVFNVRAQTGDAALLQDLSYDVILANINRNIISRDFATYSSSLSQGGIGLLSGFLEADLDIIRNIINRYSCSVESVSTKNHWAVLVFRKQ